MKDEYIRKQDAVDLFNRAVQDVGILDADDIKTVFEMLSSADVVPAVHGRWMPQKGGGLCCSECGGYALDEPDGNFIHIAVPSKFCPNCGAKMDGEECGHVV